MKILSLISNPDKVFGARIFKEFERVRIGKVLSEAAPSQLRVADILFRQMHAKIHVMVCRIKDGG
jgi:hypothetical protein